MAAVHVPPPRRLHPRCPGPSPSFARLAERRARRVKARKALPVEEQLAEVHADLAEEDAAAKALAAAKAIAARQAKVAAIDDVQQLLEMQDQRVESKLEGKFSEIGGKLDEAKVDIVRQMDSKFEELTRRMNTLLDRNTATA